MEGSDHGSVIRVEVLVQAENLVSEHFRAVNVKGAWVWRFHEALLSNGTRGCLIFNWNHT